jgi:hypothetical protein
MALRIHQQLRLSPMIRAVWLCTLLLLGTQAVAATHIHDADADSTCLVCSHGGGPALGELATVPREPPVAVDVPSDAPAAVVCQVALRTPAQPRAPPPV